MQEINEEKIEWKSCCFTLDRDMCTYVVQFTLALCTLGFSGLMLAQAQGNCERSSPYFSLISFVVGAFIPRGGAGQNSQQRR